ncbi:MAG: hypothetical protein M3Y59_13325 [Myxococcota bacterium]|nr:hypothetical protein [Myxococcota bacterium]
MAERIGSILVRRRLITTGEIDEALRAQLIYGGRLGTILVELDLLELDDLADALAEQLRYPVVTEEQLDNAPAPALKVLTPEQAQAHQAFPFALEARRVKMAMASPHDPAVQDALAFITGLRVIPFLVPELRLAFVLERRYGMKRKERFIRLAPERNEKRRRRGQEPEPADRQGMPVPDAGEKEQLFGSLRESQYLSAEDDELESSGPDDGGPLARIHAAAQAMGADPGDLQAELEVRAEDPEFAEAPRQAPRREGVPVEWEGASEPSPQVLPPVPGAAGSPSPADAGTPAVCSPSAVETSASSPLPAVPPGVPEARLGAATDASADTNGSSALGTGSDPVGTPATPSMRGGGDPVPGPATPPTAESGPEQAVVTPRGPPVAPRRPPGGVPPPMPPRIPAPGYPPPPGYRYPVAPPPWARGGWGPPPPQWGYPPPPPWAARAPPALRQDLPPGTPAPVIRSRAPNDEDRLFDEDSLDQWTLRSDPYAVFEERPPAELAEAVSRVHATRRSRPLSAEVIDRAEIWEFLTWNDDSGRALQVEADGRPRDPLPLSSPWEHTEWNPVEEDAGLEIETLHPLTGPVAPWSAVGYPEDLILESPADEAEPSAWVAEPVNAESADAPAEPNALNTPVVAAAAAEPETTLGRTDGLNKTGRQEGHLCLSQQPVLVLTHGEGASLAEAPTEPDSASAPLTAAPASPDSAGTPLTAASVEADAVGGPLATADAAADSVDAPAVTEPAEAASDSPAAMAPADAASVDSPVAVPGSDPAPVAASAPLPSDRDNGHALSPEPAPEASAADGPTRALASGLPEGLEGELETACSANEISAALLQYCAMRFGRAFVLVESGGHASVWKGVGEGTDDPELCDLRVPLDLPSALKSAAGAGAPIHLEAPEGPVDEQLFAQLSPRSPYLVIAAVSCLGAPVAFVYAESALEPLSPDGEQELQTVVELAGRAHARLRSATA